VDSVHQRHPIRYHRPRRVGRQNPAPRPGDRIIDISIQSTSVQVASTAKVGDDARHPRNSSSSNAHAAADACEELQTILIPMSRMLSVAYDVAYRRSKNAMLALADLSTVQDVVWDDSYGGAAVIVARMECTVPCGLVIERLKLHRQVSGICLPIATVIIPRTGISPLRRH